jgi:hypothetical protein
MHYSRKLGINPIISIANTICSQQFYYKKDLNNLIQKVAMALQNPHKMKAQTQKGPGPRAAFFVLWSIIFRDLWSPAPCLQLCRASSHKFVGNQQPAEMFL